EYGAMLGACFDGHPWNANEQVTIRVERPDDPIAAPFGRDPFSIQEEVYQFKDPYPLDAHQRRVLLRLDTKRTDMKKEGIHRADGEFALAWTKEYGSGRVFYTALGHNEGVWKDPRFQSHLLEGIRWALAARAPATQPLGPPRR
ncbi:MAG: ThuA domain-containing protein, partial [Tepidisphaeraceae bacterium]